jgi:hypothetical protein
LDSIEAPARWAQANLVDGIYPAATTPAGKESLAPLQEQRAAWIAQAVDADTIQELAIAEANLAEIREELASLPPQHHVYAGTIHHGSGTFLGTGPNGGEPRAIHVLHRGDVENLGPEVEPGAIAALGDSEHRFALPPDASEAAGRAALARWLTDPAHPLTWRSIVNRVWLYHFGRGLVDTPNDFGRMGQTPSHPELLDWLAASFRDGGQSLKALHRWIVTSATYRQSSSVQLAASVRARSVDGDNVYYWRMNRRRLEAEAIRDTVLALSGKLNLQMYGPAFQDFVIEKPEHSPHYQYHLHDPNDPATHRRSVYRFLVRSQQQPFMRTLDCADPSMMVDKRTESLSPLQALALLNNKFMLAMSGHFAARLHGLEGDWETKIARGFQEALGRRPRPDELASLTSYARSFGLNNACRVILNLNEFTFVD